MKKINKVSVSDFEKSAKGVERTIDVDWAGVAVTVTPTLSLTEMLEFVNSVVESCFSDDGDYIPEVKEFAIYRNVLERYANFRLPADVHKCYDLIYSTDAVDVVLDHVHTGQYNAILDAIEEKISFKIDTMADSLRAQVTELVGSMQALQEQTKHVFDDISEEDLQKMVSAIEQGGLSEEKLVAAYLDQAGEKSEEK